MPFTFQSASYSFSSVSTNGRTHSHTEATYTDPSGTKVYRKNQVPGSAPQEERIEYDRSGRRLENAGGGMGGGQQRRIEDVTETEVEDMEEVERTEEDKRADRRAERAQRDREAERRYVERMEEEYAKREGGA